MKEQGESIAIGFVDNLDKAITANNVPQLQRAENDLLDLACRDFEIIDQPEKEGLERLKHDRNLCAHPAFTHQSILYDPQPEQVRAHIVHAVYSVLKNPPTQGKTALDRLKADLLRPSFPTSLDSVKTFLSCLYLGKLKQSVADKLVKVLAKELILQADADLATVSENVARSLLAIGAIYPAEYEVQLKETLPSYTANADDEKLWRVLLLVGNDIRVWGWLDEPVRIRLRNLVGSDYTPDHGNYLVLAFNVPELAQILEGNFVSLDDEAKEVLISTIPAAKFADDAIRIFADSGSYRTAESRARNLIIPLAENFTADHIREILAKVLENGQIWNASEIPAILRNLCRLTKLIRDETRSAWLIFLTEAKAKHSSDEWSKIEQQLAN